MDVPIWRLCEALRVYSYTERTIADIKTATEVASDFLITRLFGCTKADAPAAFSLLFELYAWAEITSLDQLSIEQLFEKFGLQSEPLAATVGTLIQKFKEESCGAD